MEGEKEWGEDSMRGKERMDLGRPRDTPPPLLLLCPYVLAPPPKGGQGTREGKTHQFFTALVLQRSKTMQREAVELEVKP